MHVLEWFNCDDETTLHYSMCVHCYFSDKLPYFTCRYITAATNTYVLAHSESGNIALKTVLTSPLEVYKWCWLTVCKTHSISAFRVVVGANVPKAFLVLGPKDTNTGITLAFGFAVAADAAYIWLGTVVARLSALRFCFSPFMCASRALQPIFPGFMFFLQSLQCFIFCRFL